MGIAFPLRVRFVYTECAYLVRVCVTAGRYAKYDLSDTVCACLVNNQRYRENAVKLRYIITTAMLLYTKRIELLRADAEPETL